MPLRAKVQSSETGIEEAEFSVATRRKAHTLVPRLLDWFVHNARELPWRRTLDPYAIWVSEIMLQQTQVKTVIPYWERWLRELPDVRALAAARQDKVLKLWEGLGYYTRARNLQRASGVIVERFSGRFPERLADVLELPGVGPYTAGAICSIAFNQPAPILDGNVIRVLARVFGIDGDPKEKAVAKQLWALAGSLVRIAAGIEPDTGHSTRCAVYSGPCSLLNQSLMELGALVCTPRDPRCRECPVRARCLAFREGRTNELPGRGRRVAITERRFVAFVIEHRGKWLVRQRPAGTVNAHLWEFPSVEVNGVRVDPARLFRRAFGAEKVPFAPLRAIRHSITRYRISLEPFRFVLPRLSVSVPEGARWLRRNEVEALAFTSAHRKVWEQLHRKTFHVEQECQHAAMHH
jgi:A/G-specific adenine glycosylase